MKGRAPGLTLKKEAEIIRIWAIKLQQTNIYA